VVPVTAFVTFERDDYCTKAIELREMTIGGALCTLTQVMNALHNNTTRTQIFRSSSQFR
jgi:hypothetical protein